MLETLTDCQKEIERLRQLLKDLYNVHGCVCSECESIVKKANIDPTE